MRQGAVESIEESLPAAEKKITIREQRPAVAQTIEQSNGINPVLARVLAARGFVPGKELDDYLNPKLQSGLPAPESLKNLFPACELIARVAAERQPIAICCDFDVDGMSGGSLLSRFLLDAGIPNKVFVPDRFKDGYGLNCGMVEEIAAQKFALLITVDYGTTNEQELTRARELGLFTIVIDHHHVEQNPPADIFVNPKQAGCNFADATLCAAGLVWYVLIGLKKTLPGAKALDVRDYLDIACLGTICDMVPLRGPNRVIARKGLERLTVTRRAGLRALKDVVGISREVSCGHVGFGIGPRLNAAGRMENGDVVIQLLTTTDSKKAGRIAKRLHKLNKERQDTEKHIKEDAVRRVASMPELPAGIVVWDREFHTGVIGIVAQRLVEMFYRPSIVCGEDDGLFKGSVRGIRGFSVVDTLAELKKYLVKFGGHEGAGGFSVEPERIAEFAIAFNELCKEKLAVIDTVPAVQADTALTLSELNAVMVEEFASCAPFGIGNPAPIVMVQNVEISDVKVLKGEHLKMQVSDGRISFPALLWKVAEHPVVMKGARVHMAVKPEFNVYNGQKTIQLNVQAITVG